VQIVIPMSGFGERFRRAGYTVPKPMIVVDGKPIIAHVLDLFPGEKDVIFVCNRDHLAERDFRMEETLMKLCPTGRIAAIDPHRLGPVHAVLQAGHLLDPDKPTVVSYCDFTCYWDWADFKSFVAETRCDGAIPAYRGFHPHSLGSTFYAYCRERDGWLIDIQEKKPFTDRPMEEFASSGTYYFSRGEKALRYFRETMDRGLDVGGEFYVSLVYKPMLAAGERVAIYDLQHFMQWGTPDDLTEYRCYSETFRALAAPGGEKAHHAGAVLVPMAGLGARFAREGYDLPKPLIPVSGRPMAVQAVADLPEAERRVFVLRRDLPGLDAIQAELRSAFPECRFVLLDGVTDGQARTCLLGLDQVDPDKPLTIGACDSGALYDGARFNRLLADPGTDVIVWTMRGHPGARRHPQMYGWVAAERGRAVGVSVKTPLADPGCDPAIVGAFTFKRARDFRAAAERMIAREAKINGEYYVDTCVEDAIALGLRCWIFDIDHYVGWGTPDDHRSFEYWQSCLHKWPSHPYDLGRDSRLPKVSRQELCDRYRALRPTRPAK